MGKRGSGVKTKYKKLIIELLKTRGYITPKMLMEHGISSSNTYRLINSLLRANLIVKVSKGVYAKTVYFDKYILRGEEEKIYEIIRVK